jgi:hypothetical protein
MERNVAKMTPFLLGLLWMMTWDIFFMDFGRVDSKRTRLSPVERKHVTTAVEVRVTAMLQLRLLRSLVGGEEVEEDEVEEALSTAAALSRSRVHLQSKHGL